MALLYDSRWRSEDSDGTPLAGAKLYVYVAGTTTPITVYATAALDPGSTLTNPVVADSAGRFPQMFLAEGTLVDIVEKKSDGTTVTTYEDVITVGADTGVFERDFTNSRIKISGTAGIVDIEFGDASPDNIGGKGRLGGWAGTQADEVEIDSAATSTTGSLAVAGTLTSRGFKVDGLVQVTGSWTTAAQVDIPLSNTPSGVRGYKIELWDVDLVTNSSEWRARLAYDATPSFKTGGSDYAYVYTVDGGSIVADSAQDYIILAPSIGTTAGPSLFATMEIMTPNSGNGLTTIHFTTTRWDESSPRVPSQIATHAFGLGNYGRATYLRLYFSTVNSSGKYRVTALLGTGDA